MRLPDENTVKPDVKPGPSGKALEDFQAGGGGYPQGTKFGEPGYGSLSGAPPARTSSDPLADSRLQKKGLAPASAAQPSVCEWNANAPETNLHDATSDV